MPRAFTYIELLIVITIMAIIATLIVPSGGDQGVAQLRAAARMLVADIQFAQLDSMVHGDDRRIFVLEPGVPGYRIAAASSPAVPVTDPSDGEPFAVVFGQGRAALLADVTIAGHALDGDDRLGFGLYGELDQLTPATITLASMGSTVTITVDPTTGEAAVGPIE